jgi:hypothetical protein
MVADNRRDDERGEETVKQTRPSSPATFRTSRARPKLIPRASKN